MAAIVSGVHPLAVVAAYRSSNASQQEQNLATVVCTSSQRVQLSRQTILKGVSAARVGCLESRNQPQVSGFSKPKHTFRLRATATTELQAESNNLVADTETELFQEPDTITSSDVNIRPIELSGSESIDMNGLPLQFEDAGGLGQDGTRSAEYSSDVLTGVVPNASPSPGNAPSLLDGTDANPSAMDEVRRTVEDGSAGGPGLGDTDQHLELTQGDGQGIDLVKTDDLADALKGAQDGLNSAQDAAANSVDGMVTSIRNAVDSAIGSVKNSSDSVNGSMLRVTKSITGAYDKTVDDIQSSVDNVVGGVTLDFTSVFRVGTPANDILKEIIIVVKSATGSALAVAGNYISKAYFTTKGNVSEDVQSFLSNAEEKVSQISGPVGSAIDQAFVIIANSERAVGLDPDNPVIPVILVVGGSLFLGLGYLNSRYGGYSGDLCPSAALDLLKNEKNVVLVDIRPQESRAVGIPDLRRSTRAKFATVEAVKVDGIVRGLLRSPSEVELVLTSAVICSLKSVNGGTKIIVLDRDGGQSKLIARGLREMGIRGAYVVDGGFKAWALSGLRFKAEGPQTPLMILQEDAEAIVEEVKPTTSGVVLVLLGFVTGTYALIEWEKTLQLIGLLGLAATVYTRVGSYQSMEDAKADLRLLQKPFNAVTQAVVWIAGLLEPKKLQLATSPASSAIQGRVIQAAAKHGPISSELELVQDESVVELAVDENDGVDDNTQSQHTSLQEP